MKELKERLATLEAAVFTQTLKVLETGEEPSWEQTRKIAAGLGIELTAERRRGKIRKA